MRAYVCAFVRVCACMCMCGDPVKKRGEKAMDMDRGYCFLLPDEIHSLTLGLYTEGTKRMWRRRMYQHSCVNESVVISV